MKRQSRELRHRNVSVVLTERDALVLEAMTRFRLARTRDLIGAGFPGVHPTTAKLRLRRLFDGQFLEVRARERSEENVYTLGIAGRRWAKAQGLPVLGAPRGGHAHHLSIVRTWSAIVEVLAGLPRLQVEFARPDWELREQFTGQGMELFPDLFLVLRHEPMTDGQGRSFALAVEIDLGSEGLAVLRRKVETYTSLRDRQGGLLGWPGFGLAMTLRSPGRLPAVTQLLEELFGGWWLVWTEAEGPASGFKRLAEALDGSGLPTATGSRYDSSRGNETSPLPSARTRAGGARL